MEMVRGGISASAEFVERAHVDAATYEKLYAQSLNDPTGFWGEEGQRIDWIRPYTKVKDTSFAPGDVSIKWFEDGTLNVSANCIDRHMVTPGEPDRDHLGARRSGDAGPATSPTPNCSNISAGWPTCSRRTASGRATGSSSTCR